MYIYDFGEWKTANKIWPNAKHLQPNTQFAVCKTAEYKTAEFELPNRISNFMMTELYLPQIECQYGISNLFWR